ncbi:43166_t:CDS:2, partial [Gigaspora margarita]
DHAMTEIEKYGKRQGFKTRCYCVDRSSDCIRRCMLVCEHYGKPDVTKSKDPKKETTSKRKHKNHKLDRVHFNFQESLEFTMDMVRDIEFYVRKMNCSSQQIRKALEEKYSPSIQRIIEKKEIDPRWYIEVDWDPHSKCLRRLFYMLSDQIEWWLKFGNVILNDNTATTNHYDMALTDDETKEAHTWILQQIKKATLEAVPNVIFTNADPALIATIRDEFPTTHALHCMFHIAQNLPLNLKNTLKDHYNEFIKDFFEVQQSNIIGIFEMSSTSRVESYNSKIKKLIFNSNTTLLELAEKLSACILEEDKKTEYALFRALIPKAVLVATADTILPNVCNMLRKYLTIEILKIQEDQIK